MAIHQSTDSAEVVGRPEGAAEDVLRGLEARHLGEPDTRTVPVICFVTPRFTPWRTKKVASVTMKLGSFVFTTM